MTNCSIIVFNYESIGFLRLCVAYIRKFKHPDIGQHIYIADQSIIEKEAVQKEFGEDLDVTIVHMQALQSGYGLDYMLRHVKLDSEYVCTLDCDAFPIHSNWLSAPIYIIKEGVDFVGGLFFESNKEDIYPPDADFMCMTQCYRVGKTVTYQKLSMNAGFSRFNVRDRGGIEYFNNDWAKWAATNPASEGWSDDAVIAHYWEDKYCNHIKLVSPITHSIGRGFGEGDWGGIIGGKVFHLGYSHWSKDVEHTVGKEYGYYKAQLASGQDIVQEMVELAKNNPTNNKSKYNDK